jgi:signal peptidase I
MNTTDLCDQALPLPPKSRTGMFEPENRKSYIAVCISLWSVLSYLIITHFIVMAVEIQGASMSPTLLDGEKFLLNRFEYLYRPPHRGEIIVLRDPEDHGLSIKRIIGMPGETFEIRQEGIFINGEKFEEPYLSSDSRQATSHKLIPRRVLGVNEFYVLGDNRDYSADSRIYGPLPANEVLGHIPSR